MAPEEMNSSRYCVDDGVGGDGGDGGKAPKVVEGDWWSKTIASTEDVSKVSRLAFGRISI